MSLDEDDYGTSSVHKFEDYLVYTCSTCKKTHYAKLPVQKDFEVGWHEESGRLEKLFRHHDSSCVFVNCRGDTFFRTVPHGEPVRWLFQPPNCDRSLVCDHTADQLERYYGPFLRFHSNDNHNPLFKGYKCQKMDKDGTEFTYFGAALYNTLEYEAQRARGVSATPKTETQRDNTPFRLTEDEIERCRNDLRAEYMLRKPTHYCASFRDHSPTTISPTECLHNHQSGTIAFQSSDTQSTMKGLPPENVNLHNNAGFVPSSSDRTNLGKQVERDLSLRGKEFTVGHQQSEIQETNERDVFDYQEHKSEITAHGEGSPIFQLPECHVVCQGEAQAATPLKHEVRQHGFQECQIGKKECVQQNDQEVIGNSSHEDHLDTNQNAHADNDVCVRTLTRSDGYFHEDVSSRYIDRCTPKGQLIELTDNKNETRNRDVCDHQKYLDTFPTGEQRLKQRGETSTVFTDNKVTSEYEMRHNAISNEYKSNGNSGKFLSSQNENLKLTAFSDPMYTHQNQDDSLPNSEVNPAHTPITPDLSTVECLKLNPETSVDNVATDRKYVNQKHNDSLQNSKEDFVPTPSAPHLSNVEDLQLNPEKFVDSCHEATSDYLAQKSILPLNVGTKQKTGKQSDYTGKTAKDIGTALGNSTAVREYKTKPQGFDKPGIVDSIMTKTKEVLSGQYSRNQKVFSDMRNSFSDWYSQAIDWKKIFPFFYPFHRMPISTVFDFTVKEDGITYPNCRHIFSGLNSLPKKEMLILGSPGFGKTTLCDMITYRWASSVTDICKLCIRVSLPAMTDLAQDLSEAIVIHCKMILGGKVGDLETIRDTLRKYGEDILLLLDGYDQLPRNRKRDVCIFLTHKDIFSHSTIAVTSRHTEDKTFIGMFDRLAFINGFSKYSLRKSMESIEVPEVTITAFMNRIQGEKLDYLSELSPHFTLFAAKTIRDSAPELNIFHSLYALMENVIFSVISCKMQEAIKLDDFMELFQFLGKKCFEHLILGQRNFVEEFLLALFGNNLTVLLECNIFYVLSDKGNTRTYRTSGKALSVFFATMYLRKLWSETENHKQFLKEIFCGNSCSGDFVKQGSCLYYVGMIPEIVLKFEKDLSIQNATFEMFYDVDRVEHSLAFDSVNLLLRISDEYLSRYGFLRCLEDDEVFMNRFGEVLNMIPTETFSVEHFFYRNRFEKKDFVIIVLREDEEPEAGLYEVVRANSNATVDRIYLDFDFAKLEDLFFFVSAQLSLYLNQFSLYSNLKYGSVEDFVFELVVHLLECRSLHAAIVTCKGSVDPANVLVKINCTFQISRQYDDDISRVSFSYEGIRSHTFYGDSVTLDITQFFQRMSVIKAFISDCKMNLQNPRICIDIL